MNKKIVKVAEYFNVFLCEFISFKWLEVIANETRARKAQKKGGAVCIRE